MVSGESIAGEPRRLSLGLAFALAVAQLVSWGSLLYSFSFLVEPMQRDLGWTKSQLFGGLSFGLIVSGICAFPIGRWIDHHGGRLVMTCGSLAGALLLALWAETSSLIAFYAIWAALGVVLASVLYEPACAVLIRTYGQDFRRALLLMAMIGGFASTVFWPLTQYLVQHDGWRATLLTLAGFNLVVGVGIHFFFLTETRAPAVASAPDPLEERVSTGGSPLRNAMHRLSFWGLFLCFSAYNAAYAAITFHLNLVLAERGIAPAMIILCVAMVGPSQVLGRFLMFLLGSRVTTVSLGSFVMLLLPLSLVMLQLLPLNAATLVIFAMTYGLGVGLMTVVRGLAVPDFFGRDGYGAINGVLTLPTNMARALAPVAAATLWSFWRSYDNVLWVVFAVGCLAAVGFWLAVAAAPARKSAAPELGLG